MRTTMAQMLASPPSADAQNKLAQPRRSGDLRSLLARNGNGDHGASFVSFASAKNAWQAGAAGQRSSPTQPMDASWQLEDASWGSQCSRKTLDQIGNSRLSFITRGEGTKALLRLGQETFTTEASEKWGSHYQGRTTYSR